MATVSNWTPYGVALNITATAATVTRTSATQYTVKINASWETVWNTTTNYGMTASSGGKTLTLNPFGTYARTGSGSFTGTYSISGNGSATKTITVTFKNFNDDNGKSSSKNVTFSVTVPALASYTIKYNANGGSGAPGNQTKWKDQALTLSSTKPTRTGYSFLGWSTSSSATTATYSAGASYTANSAATLYAVWKANTYPVTFNANGGTGAPSSQTKTHDVTLTLSSTKPTRTNYNFLGWATSASATTATYAAGGNYTANTAVTLYAVWELAYTIPRITNFSVTRCDSDGNVYDAGTYALVKFDWACDLDATSASIECTAADKMSGFTKVVEVTGRGGIIIEVIGSGTLDADLSYTVKVRVRDSNGKCERSLTLNGYLLPIDLLRGNKGIAFGKPAELGEDKSLGGKGVAEFAFDAKFNEPVYGNVLGLNRLPAIPANSELNDYMDTGCWAIQSNAIAATITCGGVLLGTDDTVPPARACRFEVNSSTGEGIRLEQWSYLRQRFIPYNDTNPILERDIARGADNVWVYYDWWRSNLTPTASKKVYHEQKVLWGDQIETGMYMTSGHTATLSEKISEQAEGIDLVFCYYNGTDDTNWGWIVRRVPKKIVELEPGGGHTFELSNGKFGSVGTKYLYINDDRIVGHADNNLTGTSGSGITYANNKFVLRYVIGV